MLLPVFLTAAGSDLVLCRFCRRRLVQTARLALVDLAGSERASETNNRGQQLKDGANINRSLLALVRRGAVARLARPCPCLPSASERLDGPVAG